MEGGVGGAFFESRDPTCSLDLYFFKMLSLWYFQNCLLASFPPTLCRTEKAVSGGTRLGHGCSYSSFRLDALLGTR